MSGSWVAVDRGLPAPSPRTWTAVRAGIRSPGLVRHWALSIGAGVALGAFLAGASWMALSEGPVRAPELVLVTIPAGTAELIAAGAPAPGIPKDVRLVAGDTLVLRNDDVASHTIGGTTVAPGATLRVPVAAADGGTFLCTFHPSGSIGLDVRERPDLGSTLPAVVLLGLPIGLVIGAVSRVMAGLARED